MELDLETQKKLASEWFKFLQLKILEEFQCLEKEFSKRKKVVPKYFKKNDWKKENFGEGGGTYYILKNGQLFEKIGINHSTVEGIFPKKFRGNIPGTKKNNSYWASGISIVVHMKNPKIPAMHFNTRFVVTSKSWFGGGMDVTPSFKDLNEKKLFHKELKILCKNNKKNYNKYKNWCDKYFYLEHRKESRGIGGIFFDHQKNNFNKDFEFVRDVGVTFQIIFNKIIRKKLKKKWTKKDKEMQYIKRGRYTEFNLLYDRGTKFGLQTNGNVEGILMSLPPLAKWK